VISDNVTCWRTSAICNLGGDRAEVLDGAGAADRAVGDEAVALAARPDIDVVVGARAGRDRLTNVRRAFYASVLISI
jgi:hypothetical protein